VGSHGQPGTVNVNASMHLTGLSGKL
jgi:hypothetical protein